MSLCLHVLVCICVNVLVFSVYMCWHAWVNVLVFAFVGVHMCECPCIHRCWRASVNIVVFTFVGVHMCECPCVYTCMFLCLHLLVCMGECPCIVGVYMPYV